MRIFILITAMVLASASARAEDARNLSLADQPAVTGEAQPADAAKTAEAPSTTQAPKFVERPAAVDTTAPAKDVKTDAKEPAKNNAKPVVAQAKAKHKHYWTEARIIGELHRHGVYW